MLKVNTDALDRAAGLLRAQYVRICDSIDQISLIQHRLSLSTNQMERMIQQLDREKSDLRELGEAIRAMSVVLRRCEELYSATENAMAIQMEASRPADTARSVRAAPMQMAQFEALYESLIEPLLAPDSGWDV